MLLPLNIDESSVDTIISAETIRRSNVSSSNMNDHESYITNFVRPLIDLLPDWFHVPQAWIDDPGMSSETIITVALNLLVDGAAFGGYERYQRHMPDWLFYMIRDNTIRHAGARVPAVLNKNAEEVVSSLGTSARR